MTETQREFLEWATSDDAFKRILENICGPQTFEAFSDRTLPFVRDRAANVVPCREVWTSQKVHNDPLEAFMDVFGAEKVTPSYARRLAEQGVIKRVQGGWMLDEQWYDHQMLYLPEGLFHSNARSLVVVVGPKECVTPDIQHWIVLERSYRTAKVLFPDGGTIRINLLV